MVLVSQRHSRHVAISLPTALWLPFKKNREPQGFALLKVRSTGRAVSKGEVQSSMSRFIHSCQFPRASFGITSTESCDASSSRVPRADFVQHFMQVGGGCFFCTNTLRFCQLPPPRVSWSQLHAAQAIPAPPSYPTNPAPLGLCNHKFFLNQPPPSLL